MLENKANKELEKIKTLSLSHDVILLDYATNPDVENPNSPLSHAALIKAYIEGSYPVFADSNTSDEALVKEIVNPFHIGQKVRHPKFGNGTVESTEGERISVLFENEGLKLLSLRYAKLEAL